MRRKIQYLDAINSDSSGKYKYTPEHLRNSTLTIWSLAQYDPARAISPNQPGINAPAMSTDRDVSRILYTSNMANPENLFAPEPCGWEVVTLVGNANASFLRMCGLRVMG